MGASLFGVPVGFAVMIGVSYLTPAPTPEVQDLVDEIRTPRGGTVFDVRQEHSPHS